MTGEPAEPINWASIVMIARILAAGVVPAVIALITLTIRDWLWKGKPPANFVPGATRAASTKPPWARWILGHADALFIEPWRIALGRRTSPLMRMAMFHFLAVLYLPLGCSIALVVFRLVRHL